MFCRNLTFFRFPTTLNKTLAALDPPLAECALKPVGPMELSTRGFVSPFGRDEGVLSHRVGDCIWICLGGEEKILPSAVVNERSEEHTSELQSLMRNSYAVFCLQKNKTKNKNK